MRFIKILLYISLLWMVILAGCKDIYDPNIETISPVLAVEGLITDQPGPHLVRLRLSSKFGKPVNIIGATKALVYIECCDGKVTTLTEGHPGYYRTDPDFVASIGKSYVLHIETSDGVVYASHPQMIMPPIELDTVTVIRDVKVMNYSLASNTSFVPYNMDIYNVLASTSREGQSPKFRITTTLLVDYVVNIFNELDTINFFCYIKNSLTNFLDSDVRINTLTDAAQYHNFGFAPAFPKDLFTLGFPIQDSLPFNVSEYKNLVRFKEYGSARIVLNYTFSLNDAAYLFHQAKNQQLSDQGRFFDPISPKLPGNIKCVSDPEKSVLGFFECSSVTYTAVAVGSVNQEVVSKRLNLVDTLNEHGCGELNQRLLFFNDIW